MFGYVKESKYKELEESFEALRLSLIRSGVREEQLVEEVERLKQELVDSKASTLPDSRFNIGKAVTLLTTKLSDKTLASFCFKFTEELQKSKYSHLVSLNNYTLRQLSKDNK
jgi:hypothetical protein